MKVKAIMSERILNLVTPLGQKPTAMHTTETAAPAQGWPGAAAPLIGASLRQGSIDSVSARSTAPTTPGIRASTTATATGTTRTTACASAPSADSTPPDLFCKLVQAYTDCRRHKRSSASCMAFELDLEANLLALHEELASGQYQPGSSICFVITHPRPREVWAAQFRDRIVHHLLYNHIAPRFLARFVHTSSACIPGKGTLFAAQQVERSIRSVSRNWSRPAHYLKCDLANFFVSIQKPVLWQQIKAQVSEPWWQWLAHSILMHDPRPGVQVQSSAQLMRKVPAHKSLFNAPALTGLPIGNLSSQFFANVHLDALDQFIKHHIKARHYARYVDDFILIHESPQWMHQAHQLIAAWVPQHLGLQLNPSKTILQPVARGVDFVGHVIKPWRRTTRSRTVRSALRELSTMPSTDLFASGNSYFGLLRQASHGHTDRTRVAKLLLQRGQVVKSDLTKTYRK